MKGNSSFGYKIYFLVASLRGEKMKKGQKFFPFSC